MNASPPPRTRYCSRCLTTFPGDAERCPNLACRSARPQAGWSELLDPGALIDRTYRVTERLAIGGAGVTYLAREVDEAGEEIGPKLAIKVLYQQRDSGAYLRRLQTEAQILQAMNHPQIVECRGFVHRSGHSPYLVTRYMGGGSLLDHLRRVGPLPPKVVAGVARQICWALEVAHRQGVVHRDMKPENVLLEREVGLDEIPEIRVADFGIAKVYGGVGDRLTRVGAFVGTPQYAAPEQFEGTAPEPATDVYAVGAVILFLLTLRPVADFMAELDPDGQREQLLAHLPPKLPELNQPERGIFEGILARAMAVDQGDRCDVTTLERLLATLGADGSHAAIEASAPPPPVQQTITLPPQNVKAVRTETAEEPIDPKPPPTTKKTVEPKAVPTPTITREPAPTQKRWWAVGGVLAFGGMFFLLLAAVAGGWWWMQQKKTPEPYLLRRDDATYGKDWNAVATQLGRVGIRAERVCKVPKYQAIDVDLDTSGVVTTVALTEYPSETARACIEGEIARFSYPHSVGQPVRISLKLPD